jgi:hypothetical protein
MKLLPKIFLVLFLTSCANMVAPTGGDKDTDAPELLSTNDTKSMKHVHTRIITFEFDEYIKLNKWEEYFYISPPTKKQIQKKIKGQILSLTIEDTLSENSTYYIALNSCVKDNNEGNILDSLSYTFSISNDIDTLTLSGNLQDAYSLEPIENAWIMLFDANVNDTLIFNSTPNYISKTDKKGMYHFTNLKAENYNIVALTDFDFIYNEEEKIAFSDSTINAEKDSFISLFGFNPIIKIDSTLTDTTTLTTDSLVADTLLKDTLIVEDIPNGKLEIINDQNSACIIQLLQNDKVVKELAFTEKPFLINNIVAGKYNLKYIFDNNQDSIWNTGNWEQKLQAEKVINYPSEITIRSNWDLELEWLIQE